MSLKQRYIPVTFFRDFIIAFLVWPWNHNSFTSATVSSGRDGDIVVIRLHHRKGLRRQALKRKCIRHWNSNVLLIFQPLRLLSLAAGEGEGTWKASKLKLHSCLWTLWLQSNKARSERGRKKSAHRVVVAYLFNSECFQLQLLAIF